MPDSIRAGLYMGPVLLGVFLANGIYRTVCEGRTFATASDGMPMFLIFVPFAIYIAIKVKTHLERAAWFAFAAYFAIGALTWFGAIPRTTAAGWLMGIAGVLFSAIALWRPTKKRIAIVAAILLLVFTGSLLAQRYARQLVGRSTVFAPSRICA